MRLRKTLPSFVKRLWRLAKASASTQPLSQSIPGHLITECRFLPSRQEMLSAIPRGGVVAEVGTNRGDFARLILERSVPRELHLVDVDFGSFNNSFSDDPRVTLHCGLSHEVISSFPDESFDWIYLDADHSYDATLRDARYCIPKLKEKGLLIFNDFAHIDPFLGRYGVHRAVVQFSIENQWPFHYFVFQRAALYDVALIKLSRGAGA